MISLESRCCHLILHRINLFCAQCSVDACVASSDNEQVCYPAFPSSIFPAFNIMDTESSRRKLIH
ncbi:MAG: hypothetical protein ABH950_00940, partial [Candidatus Altiarchaeota archaeon]